MRGGNRGTVAYPLMQTESPQTAQAIFFTEMVRMFTDGNGCLRNAACSLRGVNRVF